MMPIPQFSFPRSSRVAMAVLCLVSVEAPRRLPGDPEAGVIVSSVTVLPMNADHQLPGQTVIVRGGVIVAIGPDDSIAVPHGMRHIDGRGKYLIPGLYDLYTHVHEWALPQFLAHGVTTVRNAAPGRAAHLALREDVAAGRRLGPRVLTTGPVLDGIEPSYASAGPLSSASAARRIVRAQHRAGYDAIMVYVGIEPIPYLATLEEATRLGVPVTGHTPWKVPRSLVYGSGQRSRDNLVGEIDTETGDEVLPPAERADAAVQVAAAGQWTIPTLTIHKVRAQRDSLPGLLATPGMEFIPPRQRLHWTRAMGRLVNVSEYRYSGAPALVGRLHRAGARLLVGTDAGYPFVLPGVSLSQELGNLVEAGLTPYEALRAATRDAAEFLGELPSAGTVEVGKRADLVLLDADPFADVAATAAPSGVLVAGRWLDRSALQAEMRRVAVPPADRFGGFPALECAAPASCAEYVIQVRGVVVGGERVAMLRRHGRISSVIAQSSIDPHLATQTRMEYAVRGTQRRLAVRRSMAGAQAEVTVVQSGMAIEARGGYRDSRHSWVAEAPHASTVLAGPLQGVNLDTELVGSLQLILERVARLEVGASQVIDGFRGELNEEEHEHAGLGGETAWYLSRDPNLPNGARRYRYLQQGPNGSGVSRWLLVVGVDGMVTSVTSQDGHFRIERKEIGHAG